MNIRNFLIILSLNTNYRSVIAFGTIIIIDDNRKKRAAIEKLSLKYAPNDSPENRNKVIDTAWSRFCTLEMQIERLTGKKSKEN